MRQVTFSDLEQMIAAYCNGKEVEHGKFYACDTFTGNYTAVDNSTGEMFTEVFTTKKAATEWLSD